MKCMAALVSLAKPLQSWQEGGTSSTADTRSFFVKGYQWSWSGWVWKLTPAWIWRQILAPFVDLIAATLNKNFGIGLSWMGHCFQCWRVSVLLVSHVGEFPESISCSPVSLERTSEERCFASCMLSTVMSFDFPNPRRVLCSCHLTKKQSTFSCL